MTTSYPLAEETIRNTTLADLVEVDETVRELYDRIEWVPSVMKIHRVLFRVGYEKITHPAVHDAVEAVAERLAALQ